MAARKLTLYWNPVCPFVHRALITMEEKGCTDVISERVFIPLDRDAPEFYKAINPRESVPALVIEGGATLVESAHISEYFDREFGVKNALFPMLPAARAAIREWQSETGEMIGALYGCLFADDKDTAPKAKAHATAVVAKIEGILAARVKENGGPYFLGSQFSMADVHIVPFLQRFSHTLPAYRDFEPFADAPCLRKLLAAAELRPSVFNTSQTPRKNIVDYAGFMGTTAPAQKPVVRLNPASPFGQRVTVAAALAKLDVAVELVVAAEAAGSERLPKVTYEQSSAYDSTNAMQYLLESCRTSDSGVPPLTPADGEAYGVAQFVAQEADNIGSAVVMSLKEGADAASTKKELAEAIEFTEKYVVGPWAAGAEVSFADAVLVPHLARLAKVDGDALSKAPKLRTILDAALKEEGVSAAVNQGLLDDAAFKAFVASA